MRAKDEAEFAELVAALSDRLLRTAYAVCGDQQLAEDAVQAALTSAYLAWARVRAAARPDAYLRRMVVNELLSRRRRKAWTSMTLRSAVPEAPSLSHEDAVLDHEVVWAAVKELPARQRAVVVLRYYEGLSEAEIAEVLGVRPGTVKSQCAAAMTHLRRALEDRSATVPSRVARNGSA